MKLDTNWQKQGRGRKGCPVTPVFGPTLPTKRSFLYFRPNVLIFDDPAGEAMVDYILYWEIESGS